MKGSTFTPADVSHIAKLANIPVAKNEEAKLAEGFNTTMKVVDELFQVDVDGVAATSQVTGLENVYREDAIDATQRLTQEQALVNAPKTNKGYFVVPQILDRE